MGKRKTKRMFIVFMLLSMLPIVLILFFLSFSPFKYSQLKILMGTFVRIEICASPGELAKVKDAFDSAFKRIEGISKKMNVYDNESYVSGINMKSGKEIVLDEETYNIIYDAIKFNKLTNGAFNVAVWPLIKLWSESAQNNQIPEKEVIERALLKVNNDNLRLLKDYKIKVLNDAQIDLSAIAKGYAVDQAAKEIVKHGFNDFFIDAGGDVYSHGNNCKGEAWRIGIKDPKKRSEIFDVINLANMAATTSGDYEKFYMIKGERYSHIIDPVSGYPQKGVVSATVIAPVAEEADALSTALCVLRPNEGIALIESLGDKYACLIVFEKNGKFMIYKSKDYKKYQSK